MLQQYFIYCYVLMAILTFWHFVNVQCIFWYMLNIYRIVINYIYVFSLLNVLFRLLNLLNSMLHMKYRCKLTFCSLHFHIGLEKAPSNATCINEKTFSPGSTPIPRKQFMFNWCAAFWKQFINTFRHSELICNIGMGYTTPLRGLVLLPLQEHKKADFLKCSEHKMGKKQHSLCHRLKQNKLNCANSSFNRRAVGHWTFIRAVATPVPAVYPIPSQLSWMGTSWLSLVWFG